MHLVTYQQAGQARTGVLLGESVIDLNRAYRAALRHLGDAGERVVADLRLPIDMVSLLAGGEASLNAAGRALAFAQEHRQETGDSILASSARRPDGYARLSYRQANTLWKQYTPGWDLHQLHHTAISVRAAHDYTEVDLRHFSGYTSLRSLEHYIADNRKAVKRKARDWECRQG